MVNFCLGFYSQLSIGVAHKWANDSWNVSDNNFMWFVMDPHIWRCYNSHISPAPPIDKLRPHIWWCYYWRWCQQLECQSSRFSTKLSQLPGSFLSTFSPDRPTRVADLSFSTKLSGLSGSFFVNFFSPAIRYTMAFHRLAPDIGWHHCLSGEPDMSRSRCRHLLDHSHFFIENRIK